MDSRILDPPHAQFGMVGFPYHLSHHHVYELTGHQLQSASAVPFSIDGLLNGSCAASVANSSALLSPGCGMNGDTQHYKLTGEPCCTARTTQTTPPPPLLSLLSLLCLLCLLSLLSLLSLRAGRTNRRKTKPGRARGCAEARSKGLVSSGSIRSTDREPRMHRSQTMSLSLSKHAGQEMPVLAPEGLSPPHHHHQQPPPPPPPA